MPSPFLYFAGGRLSTAELSAARLDGHLIGLGEGYVPADLVESTVLRGASLSRLLGETLAATLRSAAWVHGVIDEPPARHFVQRAVPRRIHQVVHRRLVYRDTQVDADDLVLAGGARVTTPARTLADLARSTDAEDRRVAEDWAAHDRETAASARRWLAEHRGFPGKLAAQRLLAARQDEVTR